MLATQWLNVVFMPLVVLEFERMETVDGAKTGAYSQPAIYADYAQSLVGAFALSAVFAALMAYHYGKESGLVLFAVVWSHWLLDLLLH